MFFPPSELHSICPTSIILFETISSFGATSDLSYTGAVSVKETGDRILAEESGRWAGFILWEDHKVDSWLLEDLQFPNLVIRLQ